MFGGFAHNASLSKSQKTVILDVLSLAMAKAFISCRLQLVWLRPMWIYSARRKHEFSGVLKTEDNNTYIKLFCTDLTFSSSVRECLCSTHWKNNLIYALYQCNIRFFLNYTRRTQTLWTDRRRNLFPNDLVASIQLQCCDSRDPSSEKVIDRHYRIREQKQSMRRKPIKPTKATKANQTNRS